MTNTIPEVPVELLMKADRKVAEDHEAGFEPDPTVSVVSALHGQCSPDVMMAIQYRLTALANLIIDGESGAWTIDVEGEKHTLVSGNLIVAAATAKLFKARTVGEMRFDPNEILHIALRDVEPDGSA